MKFRIPSYAKKSAKEALEERKKLPEYKKFGLDKDEARALGINSGVERAKQIIRSNKLSEADVKRVVAFYSRFKNCRTDKCEGSIKLWGGRRFARNLQSQIQNGKKT